MSDYAFFNCTGLESVYIFLTSNANPNGHYDKIPCGTIEEKDVYKRQILEGAKVPNLLKKYV